MLRSEAWGGLELYSLDFIEKQQKVLGFQVHLLAVPQSKVWSEAELRKIPVQSDWSDWTTANALHIHQRQDLPAARLRLIGRKIPFFYSLYMSAPVKKGPYHRWIYSRLQGVASSSEWVCQSVKRNFPIPADRVHCIRYGRDNQISPWSSEQISNFRKSNKAQPEEKVLCSLSRIDPEKGVGTLVEAFLGLTSQEQKKLRLWIIGDPTLLHKTGQGENVYEADSERLYADLKKLDHPQIQLFPFQSNPEGFLQSADTFFLGSTEETYSLAVIDAFLRGKPVLGTKSGGTVEQIGSTRGFFFEPKNVNSLQESLRHLIRLESSEVQLLGDNAKKWAQLEHSWDQCLQTWKKIYLRL